MVVVKRDGSRITAELDGRKTTRHANAFKKYHETTNETEAMDAEIMWNNDDVREEEKGREENEEHEEEAVYSRPKRETGPLDRFGQNVGYM